MRRPLGIRRRYPTDHVTAALRYQVATSVKLGGGRERVAGLRLVATDCDVALGHGTEARGTAIALLLAVSGRPVGDEEVSGSGAATLVGPGR
ncbi:hypothetical protein [Georgenia sp. SUBG003]|uniref:hypothetical protein n=1 Tax=Georgenia sp. SUBG003 TaxID=1497974 RepID=UPI000ADB1582